MRKILAFLAKIALLLVTGCIFPPSREDSDHWNVRGAQLHANGTTEGHGGGKAAVKENSEDRSPVMPPTGN